MITNCLPHAPEPADHNSSRGFIPYKNVNRVANVSCKINFISMCIVNMEQFPRTSGFCGFKSPSSQLRDFSASNRMKTVFDNVTKGLF